MKYFFILLFFFTNLFATTTIKVSQINNGIKTAPFEEISFIETKIPNIDTSKIDTLHWSKNNKTIFGWTDKIALVRFTLFNDTHESKTLVLRHARPGTDSIEFWVLKNEKILNYWQMGDRYPVSQRPLQTLNSSIEITMQPNESYQIISQISTSSILDTNYEIFFEKTFLEESKWQLLWWSLFAGMMLLLIIYNIVGYFGSKENAFLIHSLYSLCVMINHLGMYGFLYYMNFIENYKLIDVMIYVTMLMALIFHILYPIFLFSLKEKVPKLTYLLIIVSTIYGLMGFSFIFGYWNPDIFQYAKYVVVSAPIIWMVIFLISLYIISKNYTGSSFYFISQSFAISRIIYIVLVLNTDLVGLTLQAAIFSSFVVFMEILFITIGMSYRINKELKEKALHQNIAKLYERYIYMGSYTSNIIHQWKSPLNHLSSFVSLLKAYNDRDIQVEKEEYKKQLQELETITNNLIQISNEVYGYLTNTTTIENVNIKELITNVLKYFQKDIKNIEIHNISSDFYIQVNRAILSQVLLVLISNSLNILKKREIKNPKIEFNIEEETNSSYKLYVKDNGGGVADNVVDKIFYPYHSTTNGLGSGLFIAKKLVSEKLSGELILQKGKNNLGGATFIITLHQKRFH